MIAFCYRIDINPFWRSHTHGSYALLFNILMHHDALAVDREEMTAQEEPMR